MVIAVAAGSVVVSHVNDSGFWLVGRFFGMDVKTTLKTWTVMETLIGVMGFAIAAAIFLVAGLAASLRTSRPTDSQLLSFWALKTTTTATSWVGERSGGATGGNTCCPAVVVPRATCFPQARSPQPKDTP